MLRRARGPFRSLWNVQGIYREGLKAATGVNAILFKITKISGRISLFSRPIRDRRCISYILEWATVRGKHRPMFVRHFSLSSPPRITRVENRGARVIQVKRVKRADKGHPLALVRSRAHMRAARNHKSDISILRRERIESIEREFKTIQGLIFVFVSPGKLALPRAPPTVHSAHSVHAWYSFRSCRYVALFPHFHNARQVRG